MKILDMSFMISDFNINEVQKECVSAYKKASGKRCLDSYIHKLELIIEECLMSFKKQSNKESKCIVQSKKRGGTISFDVIFLGDRCNPLEENHDEELMYSNQILQLYASKPMYNYDINRGANIISFCAEMKPIKNKMMKEVLLSIILAIVTYYLMQFLPSNTVSFISNDIFALVFKKLIDIISALATPLVFLSVICGITEMGNSSTVGKMGKKLLNNMMISYLIAGIAFSIFAVFVYSLGKNSGNSSQDAIKQIIQLVLDICPSNMLDCFVKDNDLQVIVISIFIGLVLLSFGKKAVKINDGIKMLSNIVNKMMSVVCKTLPFIVYLGIVNMLLADISKIIQIYKVGLGVIVTFIAVFVVLLIRIKIKIKVPFKTLFKKQFGTLLINLTTSSQVAALPENMLCCKEKFGIDSKFVDFSLPLGIVAYMPVGAGFLGITVWGCANLSSVNIDMVSLIKIMIVAIIVAIAAPPIPGSALAVLPICFSACGVPLEYYSVAIICGTIVGYFLPAFNGYLMQLEVLLTAHQLKCVDYDILKKPYVTTKNK